MVKQHKNVFIYAIILLVAAAALIILSAITQNRITEQREEEIKNNLTTDITARLEKNMQQNIDDINDENTKLKAQAKEDKDNIDALKKQIDELNKLATEKAATDDRNQTLSDRADIITTEVNRAVNYYKKGYNTSAQKIIRNLKSTLENWEKADKNTQTSSQNDAAASTSDTATQD